MSTVPAAPRTSRPDRADIIVILAIAVASALLLWLGRGLTFFADEWAVIGDRPISLETFLRPFNEHWLGVTTLVHRLMVEAIGLESYLPFLAVLVALHALVVAQVYLIARRATLPLVAAGIAVILAFFGSGFENLFWAMQIGFVGAIAMGLGALLLLLDSPSRTRVIAATALLTLAVMTSGFGLFMLAFVGLDLLLDRRRWRVVPWLAIPAVVYGAWYLTLGRSGLATHVDPFTLESIAAVPGFVVGGLSEAFASALGVGRAGGLLAVVAVVGMIGFRLVTDRTVPTRAVACLGAIVVQYALLGLVRAQLEVDATYFSRYSYLSGVFALLAMASLIGRPTRVLLPRERLTVVAGAAAILTLSLIWNVRLLVEGQVIFAERADLTRAMVELGLAPELPDGVDPDLSLVLVPSPVKLRAIVERYGSPLADPLAGEALGPIPEDARTEALRRAIDPPAWLLAQPWLP